MQRALELAARGCGRVEPNPPVGAVLVDDDLRLIAEGWHQEYGGPHAEVHALRAAGDRARGATAYVTLEPCRHFGKTPPCTRALIAAGVRKVVVAMSDPAPHAAGAGIAELQAAGIEVDVGLLGDAAQRLAAPFVKLVTQRLPWVHAKWAMTLDGKLATHAGHSQWISNTASRALVHELRGRMDAILVGIETVLADDPLLTARPPGPRTATRIVLDSRGRLPLESQLVRTAETAPVWCVTTSAAPLAAAAALRERGVTVLTLPATAADRIDLRALLEECGRRAFTHVLVEGGAATLGGLHDAGLIDEWHVFIAPKIVGGAAAPTPVGGTGLAQVPAAPSLDDVAVRTMDGDVYVHGRTRRLPAV